MITAAGTVAITLPDGRGLQADVAFAFSEQDGWSISFDPADPHDEHEIAEFSGPADIEIQACRPELLDYLERMAGPAPVRTEAA